MVKQPRDSRGRFMSKPNFPKINTGLLSPIGASGFKYDERGQIIFQEMPVQQAPKRKVIYL